MHKDCARVSWLRWKQSKRLTLLAHSTDHATGWLHKTAQQCTSVTCTGYTIAVTAVMKETGTITTSMYTLFIQFSITPKTADNRAHTWSTCTALYNTGKTTRPPVYPIVTKRRTTTLCHRLSCSTTAQTAAGCTTQQHRRKLPGDPLTSLGHHNTIDRSVHNSSAPLSIWHNDIIKYL